MKQAVFFLLLLTSCGYRVGTGTPFLSVSIPYIEGDDTGEFTRELIKAANSSSKFTYENSHADAILQVKIVSVSDSIIGFQKDRLKENGALQNNIRPIEGRKHLHAEVNLVSSKNNKSLWGPHVVTMEKDYDYVDMDSLEDLSFINADGRRTTVLNFSLGQLEDSEDAGCAVFLPLYQVLSKKIVDMISVNCDENQNISHPP